MCVREREREREREIEAERERERGWGYEEGREEGRKGKTRDQNNSLMLYPLVNKAMIS